MKRLQKLKMIFRGVRGSRPVHHPDFLTSGGNSTTIQFECDRDFHLFIDAGTGLGNLAYHSDFKKRKRFHILVTHTHWDHIISIPSFLPLYDPEAHVTFYATKGSNGHFPELYQRLLTPGHYPHQPGLIKAKVDFIDVIPRQPFTIESAVKVEAFQLNHQAVTVGYKIAYGHSHVVVITDTAPFQSGNYLGDGMKEKVNLVGKETFEKQYHDELLQFLKGVTTLVYDSHFNDENLKPDWGHSTPRHGLDLCIEAQIKKLILFHHAPEDDEAALAAKLKEIKAEASKASVDVANAREEDEWDLKAA